MISFKYSLGLIFVTIIAICPVLLWLLVSPTPPSFSSSTSILLSLGQLTAILGTTFFALNFILSARLHFLEKIFLGLNRLYYFHHYLGAASLILLLFHPVLLSLQYLPSSIIYVAKFFIPSLSAPENIVGALALLTLIILLYITFFTKIKYQLWKFSHQLLGLSFAIAIIHMLLVPGNLSQNDFLKLYLLVLSALALLAYIYRTLLFKKLVRRTSFTVSSVKVIGEITEISFTPVSKPISFLPGQFVFIEVNSKGISSEVHPFSLISSPTSTTISIAAKSLGDYTETLKLIKTGDTAQVEGPFGVFSYLNTANTRQLWIAGGIGITPFLSMLRSLDPVSPYEIDIIYSVVNKNEAIYIEEFIKQATLNSKFHFHLYVSSTSGRLDTTKISSLVPNLKIMDVFICGPALMMNAIKSQLIQQGMKSKVIHTEEFALYQGK